MTRNQLIIPALIFCFSVLILSTQASDSQTSLSASVVPDYSVVPTDDWTGFYDKHAVEIFVTAPQDYSGWTTGDCYVTGNGERDEDFIGNYYSGGVFEAGVASLIFWDLKNVAVPGDGWGWCRIHGSSDTDPGTEAEDSGSFYF